MRKIAFTLNLLAFDFGSSKMRLPKTTAPLENPRDLDVSR
jgi:hypothetical protein